MLNDPARDPRKASSRFTGGTRNASRRPTRLSRSSLRRTTGQIAFGMWCVAFESRPFHMSLWWRQLSSQSTQDIIAHDMCYQRSARSIGRECHPCLCPVDLLPMPPESTVTKRWRPQRDSNPRFSLERATSCASGRWGRSEASPESPIISRRLITGPNAPAVKITPSDLHARSTTSPAAV